MGMKDKCLKITLGTAWLYRRNNHIAANVFHFTLALLRILCAVSLSGRLISKAVWPQREKYRLNGKDGLFIVWWSHVQMTPLHCLIAST